MTLVFCIAIMGNVADYLHSGGEGQHWRYDFQKGMFNWTIQCHAQPLKLFVISIDIRYDRLLLCPAPAFAIEGVLVVAKKARR